ncbi:hypothetical protein [Rothia kristinae]|uniref:hypothetical protein n=1 Tax=Rothia kristinae TaxID=37923 RepID=UPI003402FD45
MRSAGPQEHSQASSPGGADPAATRRKAVWATVVGMAVLVAIFIAAIWRAADVLSLVRGSLTPRTTSAPGQEAGRSDSMRDEKLAHSFQIVLVQKKVVAEELAKGEDADAEMIDRALDTIDFTAKNGMGLARSAQPAAQEA